MYALNLFIHMTCSVYYIYGVRGGAVGSGTALPAGSITDGVIGNFHRLNPSGRTVTLGSTQPGGKGGRYLGLTTFLPSCANCLEIMRTSTSWSPKGLFRPYMCVCVCVCVYVKLRLSWIVYISLNYIYVLYMYIYYSIHYSIHILVYISIHSINILVYIVYVYYIVYI
jgi:hypothetical protein